MITTKSSFLFFNYGLKTGTAGAVAAVPAPTALYIIVTAVGRAAATAALQFLIQLRFFILVNISYFFV